MTKNEKIESLKEKARATFINHSVIKGIPHPDGSIGVNLGSISDWWEDKMMEAYALGRQEMKEKMVKKIEELKEKYEPAYETEDIFYVRGLRDAIAIVKEGVEA